jgi:lysozyme family protein
MAAENYDASLKRVLVHEGGYSNDKNDPGGPTMWGITHIDYDAFRRLRGLETQDVRKMTKAECDAIYRKKYWTGSRCDDLPAGVDYCVFDGSVNSGVAQSAKWLQRALGVTADGHIGDRTLLAAKEADAADLVRSICDQRMKFLRALRTFPTFGKGWTRRVSEVRAVSLGMVGDEPEEIATPDQVQLGAKAARADISEPMVGQGTATAATAGTASASAVVQQVQEQLAPYSETLTAIKYALIACALVGLGFTIYAIWKASRVREVS